MKKTTYILAAAFAVLAVSCAKETIPSIGTEEGQITTFVGSSVTKITVGQKEGTTYKALWAEGDSLSIVATEGGSVLGTAKLSSGAGTASGVFTTTAQIADGTSVKLVYGSPVIPADQTQASVGEINLDGVSYAASEALTFNAGSTKSFTLVHSPALVKVKVSSTEFAGLSLKGVAIYCASKTLAAEAEPYAEVTFTKPALLADAQEAWLSVNPVTENADFYVAAIMTGEVDGVADATVSIPVKFEGKTLQGGKVNVISLENLTTASNAIPWYEPVCTRYIPMKGWAYGKANTIVILGNTVGSSTTFDLKARGDVVNVLRYAREPKKMKLQMCDIVNTGTWNTLKINGTVTTKAGVYNVSYSDNTIEMANAISSSKTHCASIITLLDADSNPIWSFGAWITPEIKSNMYECGIEVMAHNNGGYDSETGGIGQCRGFYYQWGRPFPFGYGNDLQVTDNTFKVTDLGISAAHPNSLALISDKAVSTDWWTPAVNGDYHNDLWGNASSDTTSTAGVKTVFDPCPKGWMVCCPAVLNEIMTKGEHEYNGGSAKNCIGLVYNINGNADRWVNAAFRNGDTGSRGSNKGQYFCNAACGYEHTWVLETSAGKSVTELETTFGHTWRANAASVRCMKDAENR